LEIEKPFTSTTIQLQQGDILYLSTDGYADQFGGPKGKKFKYKALHEMLMTNSTLEMGIQKTKLDEAFIAWKNKQEQVDDVAVIGVRIV
jgi:serine phosphatase RsbU (regulator of sigma subunit)